MTDPYEQRRDPHDPHNVMPEQFENPIQRGAEFDATSKPVGRGIPSGEAPIPLEKQTSLAGEAWGELRRNPLFVVSSVVVLGMIFIAIFPQVFAPVRPIFGATTAKAATSSTPSCGALVRRSRSAF
jgi:oligopeptide transport system permease protein